MTIHKLSAGDGYTYLTKHTANADAPESRVQDAAGYYTAAGAPPGRWYGKLTELVGVEAGQVVTESHMRSVFGAARTPTALETKPSAEAGMDALIEWSHRTSLGRGFVKTERADYVLDVEKACANYRLEHGSYPSAHVKERIKFEVAEAVLRAQRGSNGDVLADADIRKWIADQYAATRASVAGYDLVFTPAKSVSVLWALGDDQLRRAVQAAHAQAVTDTLSWIEEEVAYTRRGAGGKEVIKADGLLIARFDHWDNRAGDPNLHTHAAIANRVHADGRWTTIDGRVFYRAAVAASERYNSRIADILTRQLGVSFSPKPGTASGKQPVYEIDGVPLPLLEEFARRGDIEERMADLADEYLAQNGKNPTKKLQYAIAQRATLETRKGKKAPQTLGDLRTEWSERAARVLPLLSGEPPLAHIESVADGRQLYDSSVLPEVVREVAETLSRRQGTWTVWNISAEVQRRLRQFRFSTDSELTSAAHQATESVVSSWCIEVFKVYRDAPERLADRTVGDVQRLHTTDPVRMTYTSQQVLNAEEYMRLRAEEPSPLTVPQRVIERATIEIENHSGHTLGGDQAALVAHFLTARTQVAVGVGAAGTGKTTAMTVVARAWERCHGKVVALGPSARAAEVLGEEVGVEGRTIADVLTREQHGLPAGINAGDLLLVDEAGMASARNLAELTKIAVREGAVVRLLGDPQQLPSVESSGILRDLAERTQAPMLSTVHRFTTDGEAQASLRLRAGQAEALDWYSKHRRIREGMKHQLPELVFDAYTADVAAGKLAVMIAPTNDLVTDLNIRAASFYRANGTVTGPEVSLADGVTGAAGDIVVTRRNTSKYEVRGKDGKRGGRIRNGDLWRIIETRNDGSLLVENQASGGKADLPVDYVTSHVQLGYATTVHRAQGMTVATAHVLADATMARQSLYVALTRGKHANTVYVANDELPDFDAEHTSEPHPEARGLLARIIARDGAQKTALEDLAAARAQAESLAESVTLYTHAAMVLYSGLAERIIADAHGEAIVARLLADPAWDKIVYAAGQSESFGWDTTALLTRATADVGDVSEAVQRYSEATGELPRRRQDLAARFQLVAITPPVAAIDPIVAVWASEQLAHVGGHVARYLETSRAENAAWLAICGTAGADAERRRAFSVAIDEIAMSRLQAEHPGDDPLAALREHRRDAVAARLKFATSPLTRGRQTDTVLLADKEAVRSRWEQAGFAVWQAREAISRAQTRHRAAVEYLEEQASAVPDPGTLASRMRMTAETASEEIERLRANLAMCEADYRSLNQQIRDIDLEVGLRGIASASTDRPASTASGPEETPPPIHQRDIGERGVDL